MTLCKSLEASIKLYFSGPEGRLIFFCILLNNLHITAFAKQEAKREGRSTIKPIRT